MKCTLCGVELTDKARNYGSWSCTAAVCGPHYKEVHEKYGFPFAPDGAANGCWYSVGSLVNRWVQEVLASAGKAPATGAPTSRAEAPCRSCQRPNDIGVKTCWCCGGTP